jgi:gluconate 2-dehydrogenase alpha chain
MPLQDWGVSYAEMEPYHALFEQLFGLSGQAGANLRGPRRGHYPLKPLLPTEAGLVFKSTCERLGYKAFPTPAPMPRPLYQSRWSATGPVPVLRPLRALHLRGQGEGIAATAALPDAAPAQGFELRSNAHVLGLQYDARGKRHRCALPRPADRPRARAARRRGGAGRLHDEQHASAAEQPHRPPYDPVSGHGVVGKNFCYQVNAGVDLS